MIYIANNSGLDRLASLLQPLTHQRRDFVKDFRAVNRHFAEDFSVQLDISQRKSINESGIRQTAHLGSRLDSDDPQGAKFSFTITSIAIREDSITDNRLFDETQQVFSAAVATFHLTKQSLVRSTTRNAETNSHDDIR